jgi:hypothetical protein
MGIWVQAVLLDGKVGYYNHKRRRNGEVFQIADEKAFSDAGRKGLLRDGVTPIQPGWMTKVAQPIIVAEKPRMITGSGIQTDEMALSQLSDTLEVNGPNMAVPINQQVI